jgi:hypothetical protein
MNYTQYNERQKESLMVLYVVQLEDEARRTSQHKRKQENTH